MSSQAAKRILVVEDDPVVAMVVEDTLREMGLDVLVNLNLADALAELDVSDFDIALVDMGLRGDNARPVVLLLLERGIPFIVMSGVDQLALKAEFPQVRTILKPLNMQALEQQVLEMLDFSLLSSKS